MAQGHNRKDTGKRILLCLKPLDPWLSILRTLPWQTSCAPIREELVYILSQLCFMMKKWLSSTITSLIILVQILCGLVNQLTELGPVEGASQCWDMPVECVNAKDQDSPTNATMLKLVLCVSDTL